MSKKIPGFRPALRRKKQASSMLRIERCELGTEQKLKLNEFSKKSHQLQKLHTFQSIKNIAATTTLLTF